MPRLSSLLTLVAFAASGGVAHAASQSFTLQAHEAKAGIAITVPGGVKLLTVELSPDAAAAEGAGTPIVLYLRPNTDFNLSGDLEAQAGFYSIANSGESRISIGTYSSPALAAGTWYVAAQNTSDAAIPVTLTTSTSTTNDEPVDIVLHFDAPSASLVEVFGGVAALNCNVAPWTDATEAGSSTLGEVRKALLQQAATKLGEELRSPVPVHIQACWQAFEDDDPDDGSYTLAAATGTYIYVNTPGLPYAETWYNMAPMARLAGTLACNTGSTGDCSIPDIVVWFNSADVAKHNYDQPTDAPLIVAVTMHEITHGLGFLSDVTVSEGVDDDNDASTPDVPNPELGKFYTGRNDAYTMNVGYLFQKDPHGTEPAPFADDTMVSFADLAISDRQRALSSGNRLVWTDNEAAANPENNLNDEPYPFNLVKLHAPSNISPGSTLSHIGPDHYGQLMCAFIQPNLPDTLGLAKTMLEHAGWNTQALSVTGPSYKPITGTWYDPEHSGHGIDLQRAQTDPVNGDVYTVIFYTYDAQGESEYYLAAGNLKNGHFGTDIAPVPLVRFIYSAADNKTIPDPASSGSVSIDFTSAAATDAACAGHASGTPLAVMRWSIDGESAAWCMESIAGDANKPDPATDLNGLWYAGQEDSGWGLTVGELDTGSNLRIAPILLYYYDTNNQPHWLQAEIADYTPGTTTNLYKISGYCRTCAKIPTSATSVGTITVNLNTPDNDLPPSGENTISINANGGGALRFNRNNAPVSLISLPPGE